jgi:hypothetical protein
LRADAIGFQKRISKPGMTGLLYARSSKSPGRPRPTGGQPAEKSALSTRNNTYGNPKNTGIKMRGQPDGFRIVGEWILYPNIEYK